MWRCDGQQNVLRVLVGKLEGRRPLGRSNCRCENIKMNLNVVGIDIARWICVTYIWIQVATSRESGNGLSGYVMCGKCLCQLVKKGPAARNWLVGWLVSQLVCLFVRQWTDFFFVYLVISCSLLVGFLAVQLLHLFVCQLFVCSVVQNVFLSWCFPVSQFAFSFDFPAASSSERRILLYHSTHCVTL